MEEYNKYRGEWNFTIFLENTKAEDFRIWFSELADKSRINPKDYLIDDGYRIGNERLFRQKWLPLPLQSGAKNQYTQFGRMFPEILGDGTSGPQSNFSIYSLQWLQTGSRLKLVVTYEKVAIYLPPLIDFLESIGKDWPNTRKPIIDLVTEIGQQFNLDKGYYLGIVHRLTHELQTDLSRPDGYEVLADNTGGTALYKRDEHGDIVDEKLNPNTDWAFKVGQKSISLEPAFEVNLVTDELQQVDNSHGHKEKVKEKPKENAQFRERALIWRTLHPWIKQMNIRPKPKNCIEELKKKPAYRDQTISDKRMRRILKEGLSGAFDDFLKNV